MGEPDAGLRGQVSELGDVTGNAGQGEDKVLEMAITAPIATIIHATHATFFAIRAMRVGSVLEVRRSLTFSSPRSSANRQLNCLALSLSTRLSVIAFSLAFSKYQ